MTAISERDQAILRAYAAGGSLSEVGAQFGLCPSRISKILHLNNAQLSASEIKSRQRAAQARNFKIVWNDDLDEHLRVLKDSGYGNRAAGEIMGFSEPTIAKRVKDLGLLHGTSFIKKECVGII
jgi:hypothetical protein